MSGHQQNELRVAIAGLGSIGTKVAAALDEGIDGLALSAVAVREPGRHRAFLGGLRRAPAVVGKMRSGVADRGRRLRPR